MTSLIENIRKRNGSVVPFEVEKILRAIERAFIAEFGAIKEPARLTEIVKNIVQNLENNFRANIPSVEDVQNAVEKELMKAGFFEVARSYIIYRYEHEKTRKEKKVETQEKVGKGTLQITKRNGERVVFDPAKLKQSLVHLLDDSFTSINLDLVISQVRLEIFDGISSEEIEDSVLMVLRALIERDPEYSYFAARLLSRKNNQKLLGESYDYKKYDSQLRDLFPKKIHEAVQEKRLDARMLLFDMKRLALELDFSRDHDHNYLSTYTLFDRYLLRNPKTGDLFENIQMFWMRIAMGLALEEKNMDDRAIEFYHTMSKRLYIPSTPTLFHSGTPHSQMSSCYVSVVEDDLHHIFKTFGDSAQMLKWSGGIGTDWTAVRATGALIKSTGVESQGTIPFLKISNDTTISINRSGRRRGAACVFMETWHYDIEDYLELRKNTGDERRRTHNLNTANWIPDLFMKRVREDGDWSLFSPEEVPELHLSYGKKFEKKYIEYEAKGERGELGLYKKIKAKTLWKKMLTMLFETGHPWITFKDPCNLRSPQDHAGVVRSSNLCTEITLNSSKDETAVCNLGSVNLGLHVENGELNIEKLEKTVKIAMRMLDNVIDLNFYPTPETATANRRHRAVGLGIMGFQNALYKMNVNFDSDQAVRFADESMEHISYFSILASSELARERGAYPSFEGSKWDRGILPVETLDILEKEREVKIPVSRNSVRNWDAVKEHIQKYGMRNSNCMSVAPTATISNVGVSTPGIEPIYKNIYVKSNQAGDFIVVNPFLVKELKALNLWNSAMLEQLKVNDGSIANISEIPENLRRKYKEVFEIDMKVLINIAAHRAKWIDQSQSLNIFFSGTSGRELNDVYMHAWEMGLKTTYYLRTLGASQVEKSTVKTQQHGSTHIRNAEAKQNIKDQKVKSESGGGIPKEKRTPLQKVQKVSSGTVKLCKIDDPSCESCQ